MRRSRTSPCDPCPFQTNVLRCLQQTRNETRTRVYMKCHRPARAGPPARDAVGHAPSRASARSTYTLRHTSPTLGVVGVKNTPTSLHSGRALPLCAKQCTRLPVRPATAFAFPYASGAHCSVLLVPVERRLALLRCGAVPLRRAECSGCEPPTRASAGICMETLPPLDKPDTWVNVVS